MNIISVENLNFSFDKNKIFSNVSFDIRKGSLVSITTPSSKGKTTMLNLINGNIYSPNIYINSKSKLKISTIYTNVNFYSKTILEELLLVSSNLNKIKRLLKEFNLINYINQSPLNLNYVQMHKLNLIKIILNKSEIILMDNIFSYFDKYSKIEFIGLLKKYQQEKNITIIYTTNNLDDTIFCDKIIIIDKELLYDGSLDKIYMNSSVIKKAKLNVPLENELMEKLNLYNVIDNTSYTIEDVVEEICK